MPAIFKIKLTYKEKLAVHIAIKAAIRMKKSPVFYRHYVQGYLAGVQAVVYGLSESRRTVRLVKLHNRCTRVLERLNQTCPPNPRLSAPSAVK